MEQISGLEEQTSQHPPAAESTLCIVDTPHSVITITLKYPQHLWLLIHHLPWFPIPMWNSCKSGSSLHLQGGSRHRARGAAHWLQAENQQLLVQPANTQKDKYRSCTFFACHGLQEIPAATPLWDGTSPNPQMHFLPACMCQPTFGTRNTDAALRLRPEAQPGKVEGQCEAAYLQDCCSWEGSSSSSSSLLAAPRLDS